MFVIYSLILFACFLLIFFAFVPAFTSHRAKANREAKNYFDVWNFFFDLFRWLFDLFLRSLSLGVNGPLPISPPVLRSCEPMELKFNQQFTFVFHISGYFIRETRMFYRVWRFRRASPNNTSRCPMLHESRLPRPSRRKPGWRTSPRFPGTYLRGNPPTHGTTPLLLPTKIRSKFVKHSRFHVLQSCSIRPQKNLNQPQCLLWIYTEKEMKGMSIFRPKLWPIVSSINCPSI